MPRRIYSYDIGQGWESFNWWSSLGVAFQFAGALFFMYNFFKSRSSGEKAPNDAWGSGTLEWSIPSPPPDYNFAQLPVVTSRYPLWDLKHPEMTAQLAHSAPDQMTITDSHAVPMHEESEYKTAKELGIPMPFPTIKPLFAALFMVTMVGGLVFIHAISLGFAVAFMIVNAALFIGTLYGWLTSPLE
jgi:cytochrome c oxidase subunit 1